jgi:hypothetical protein
MPNIDVHLTSSLSSCTCRAVALAEADLSAIALAKADHVSRFPELTKGVCVRGADTKQSLIGRLTFHFHAADYITSSRKQRPLCPLCLLCPLFFRNSRFCSAKQCVFFLKNAHFFSEGPVTDTYCLRSHIHQRRETALLANV